MFVVGRAISVLGDGFATIAMGWLVYDLTGSKLAMGSLYLAGMVPEIVLRLVGAPLIDRLNRTRLMAVLDTAQTVAYLTPLVLSLTGHLQLWHLYALYVASGIAHSLYRPSVMAVVPSLVKPEQLTKATATLDGLLNMALVTGPVVAGFVMVYLSGPWALAFDALSFGISALMLYGITAGLSAAGASKRQVTGGSYFGQLIEGFAFFKQVPALFLLSLMLGISNVSAWAIFALHAPYVKEHLHAGPEIVGFMQACWPLGFLLGTLLISRVGEIKSRRTLMLGALAGAGIALGGLGFVPTGMVAPALALKVLEGFSFSLFSNSSTVLFQRMAPGRLLGRVMSVRMLLAWGGNPLGAFLGALLSERVGIPPTFVLAGALSLVVGLAGFAIPTLRDVDGELKPVELA
jgi:MFS family permease